ncbi:MAG: reductive dehalogenase [Dehalogenimonas sp.]
MSKFHSTISRREFMKGLGLAGAGLGAAAVVSPNFHDLDEVTADSKAGWKRSWWVKEGDEPSNPIDWQLMQRLDQRQVNSYMPGGSNNNSEEMKALKANNTEYVLKWCIENYYPEYTGNTTRDNAMNLVSGISTSPYSLGYAGPFDGMGLVKTPEQLGIPRWESTPEDNLKTLRAAFRSFGAADVACIEITPEKTRKIIWTHQQRNGELPYPYKEIKNKSYEFEDVPKAYYTDTKMVIPENCRTMIVWTALMQPEITLREGSPLGKSSTSLAYARSQTINTNVAEFVRALGYQSLNAFRAHMTCAAPRGILSGVGEHNRMCLPTMSPEYGMFVRTVNGILTDMPVATTKPVNAGMYKFCETCGICADSCPYGALPKGKPSWESEFGSNHSIHAGNTPGYEGYRMDVTHCTKCGVCQGSCPFNSISQSWVHSFVKATSSTTALFNSFFTTMDKSFGYGLKNPEDFWNLKEHWSYGFPPNFIGQV